MANETQDSISSSQSSYLEAIFDPFDGSSKLLSTISSANFNGAIPDLIIQYPDATTDDLIPGRFFLSEDNYYLITRIDENIDPETTNTISYNVWYASDGTEKYKTILDGVKIFTDGTELQIRKDDWANKSIGDSGWTITTEGNSVFSNVAVRGTIEATDGYFDGHLYVGDPDDPDSPGGMRIGTNVDGTREIPGTQDGIYINQHNYWYDSGLFKIGNSTKNVTWNNENLVVTGDINATGGIFSGKVKIGDMYLGVNASPTLEDGIYIDGTNFWYDNGNFSLGTGTSTISFNGSNILFGTGIEISGSISANSLLLNNGTFSMAIQSNHNVIPTSQRTVNQLVLSSTNPELVLTTSTNHNFVENDFIYLSGLSNSGGGLGALNKVFQVSSVTLNTIRISASQSTESILVTADNSDTTLTVVDSEGVYVGMSVSGVGIASNTTVTNVTDTVITISNATTQSLSDVLITFSTILGTYDSSDSGWTNGMVQYSYDGIYINQSNYWYSNGLFGIGDGTKGLTWDGSELNVTGIINASEGGSMAGWSIGSDEIFKGTGSSKIALNAGSNPKIYIGSGFHASAGTGFYVDSTGKFSLSNLLTFSPSVDIPEALTTGTFNSGTNTITVASASGIVKGMTVIGTGIAPNSTVTNISGTTITTSKNATANGSNVSLTFVLDDFSELQVNGRIKGVIESTSPISSPRIGTTATSVVVSEPTGSQIATITTTGHAFITGEKILIENLPSTNGLNNLNRQFSILSVTDSITLVISLSGITGVTNSTNTSLSGSVSLRELTMGLHPAQGTGSYSHLDGTGIRLDKFNWWFTNNQFRVGSVDSYIKWTTDPSPLLDVVGQIRATSGYIGGTTSGWVINSGIIQSSSGTSKITLDALNAKMYVGTGTYNNSNTAFYADGESKFSLGDKLSFNNGSLSVTGIINATSGNFTSTVNIGNGSVPGTLKVGVGTNSINIVGTNSDTTTFIRTGSSITATTGNGFYFGADGKIRVASATNSLTFDGTSLNIVGGGTFTGALSGGTISIGSGNSIFKADTNGIYLGNATFGSAPFRVTNAGALTATNASITGAITATSGSFTSFMTAGSVRFGIVDTGRNGIFINSNNYFTSGNPTGKALRVQGAEFVAGSELDFAQSGSNRTWFRFYEDPADVGTNQWEARHGYTDNGNYSIQGTDYTSAYTVLQVRAFSYGGVLVRAVDNASTSETLTVVQAGSDYTPTGSYQFIQFFRENEDADTSTASGGIVSTSAGATPTFFSGSDVRLKNTIEEYNNIDSFIEDMKNIDLYTWYSNEDIEKEYKNFGWLAKDWSENYPDLASGYENQVDEDGNPVYQLMYRENMIPYLYGVIKNLVLRVEELERLVN